MDGARPVRSPRGTTLTARSWQTEAPLRMLQNNLDPEVAERPDDLVVYGGTGRAARDWRSFDAMVRTLSTLDDDETMLVQSGRPVGVFRTHEWAPRVLIANSNLVPDWATWPEFRRLEQLGLTMYGQMTAGSWIYIGTQGILQGTYETFAAVAAKRFGGTLAGTLTLTGGCGGMGGAQPLAVTLNGGVCLVVDVDESRLRRRVAQRYLDEVATDLDDAVERCLAAKLGRPLRRPPGHRGHRSRRPGPVPRERPPAALDPGGAGQSRVPGAAGPHLLAGLRRTGRRGPPVQRDGRLRGDQRADRDRPRPPRLRIRGLPVPRDRGDGRRLGRDRRLAAAQCPRQHRLRRHLGVDPPRRWGRHRPVDPRGTGQRRRRHVPGRAEAGAGAAQRSGHGRAPARRRRVRPRGPGGRGTRRPGADDGELRGAGQHVRRDVGRSRAGGTERDDRRLPPLRVDPHRRRAARVVPRRGSSPGSGGRVRPVGEPVGLDRGSRRRGGGRPPRARH